MLARDACVTRGVRTRREPVRPSGRLSLVSAGNVRSTTARFPPLRTPAYRPAHRQSPPLTRDGATYVPPRSARDALMASNVEAHQRRQAWNTNRASAKPAILSAGRQPLA